jgi:SsrA-binding protein
MSGVKKDGGFKLVTENRKAFHEYFILDRFETGLVLTGTEIKSSREGKVQLRDS